MNETRTDPSRIPASTYRLQFNRFLTFCQATALADYLDELGVSDCYASPILKSHPGSLHGYDVTDHSNINPEIGSGEEFCEFAVRLKARGMGLILDVVPNHMCISDQSNAFWWDVLENGPSSPYARYFDIDWQPLKEELADKVLLPVLGEQYGRILENQELGIIYDHGAFYATYYQTQLPLAPGSWLQILEPATGRLKRMLGESHEHVLEFESILTALSYLPPRTERDEAKVRERQREKEIIKRRLSDLVEASENVRRAIEDSVSEINGRRGDPASFDRLEHLLAEQAYRVSFWKVAADEINYRRFFDINDLAAIRVEEPVVFTEVHALVLDLIRKGYVSGLRIDHPDGLFEPEKYFRDLQEACLGARLPSADPSDPSSQRRPFFVIAEKIVMGNEELRPWAIEGTTGYGYLNFLNGLFVESTKRRSFQHLYQTFTGWSQPYEDTVYESKKLILQVSLSSELNVLARRLDRLSEQHRWSRDFTLVNLRDALREVVNCFPIYRTYIGIDTTTVDPEDERHIRHAISTAKHRNPAMSESVFEFIQSLLLLQDPDGLNEEQRAERRMFVMRLQQFTGPVMAKGLEDTTFYRYFPLASLNEVGGDPRQFGVSPDFFHNKNLIRQTWWPNALVATSTHDSKRGEDVRARINVLSEIPADWYLAIRSWQKLNRGKKTSLPAGEAPGPNEEYLLYQTLVGTWPFRPMDAEEHNIYVRRIQGYMEKALREAKLRTSWVSPNVPYEEGVSRFIAAVLEPSADNRFLDEFIRFQSGVARAGVLNSLSQVLLKIASPGVPDFYQGCELWNLDLVDPDNRNAVDYAVRRTLLEQMRDADSDGAAELVERLLADPADGAIKLYITSRALRFRRANQELFAKGAYVPLRADGKHQNHLISFARVLGGRFAIAVAGRFFMDLGGAVRPPTGEETWGDSAVILRRNLRERVYRDVFTQQVIAPERRKGKWGLPLARLFSHLPVALLVSEVDRKAPGTLPRE